MSSSAAIALLNPFENDYPDRDPCSLNGEDNAIEATCCAFNASGTYLAVGCQEGLVVAYDMLTQLPARSIQVHDGWVYSVSWIRSSMRQPRHTGTGGKGKRLGKRGSLIISSGKDHFVKIINSDTAEQLVSVHFLNIVANVYTHPRMPWHWLVSYAEVRNQNDSNKSETANTAMRWPVIVDVAKLSEKSTNDKETDKLKTLYVGTDTSDAVQLLDCEALCQKASRNSTNGKVHVDADLLKRLVGMKEKQTASCAGVIAIWSRKAKCILVGGLGCTVFVLSARNYSLLQVCTPPTSRGLAPSAWVKAMRLSKNGKFLVTNSIGKLFCLYAVDTDLLDAVATGEEDSKAGKILSFRRDFQDTVNNTKWKRCAFSGDSEFVLGAASNKDRHSLYVWDIQGNLMTILEGPSHRGVLRDAVWHPTRPIIVSVDANGEVHVWTKKYSENWSAFAPNFTEIEENTEYVEREDEFDRNPREDPALLSGKSNDNGNEVEVDVVTIEQTPHLLASSSSCDSSEAEDVVDSRKQPKRPKLTYFIPVIPGSAKTQVNHATETDTDVQKDEEHTECSQ